MRISDWSSDVCSSDLSAEWFMAGRSTATRLRRPDAIRSPSIAAPPEIHPRSGVIPDELEDPRSEERRVGQECVSHSRSWWSHYHYKNNHCIYQINISTRILSIILSNNFKTKKY